jgi:hypothetical protein
VPSKATRADHYRAIAEFYGRQLVDDMRNPALPEFVLVTAARRAARFAAIAMKLEERMNAGRKPRAAVVNWPGGSPSISTLSATPS